MQLTCARRVSSACFCADERELVLACTGMYAAHEWANGACVRSSRHRDVTAMSARRPVQQYTSRDARFLDGNSACVAVCFAAIRICISMSRFDGILGSSDFLLVSKHSNGLIFRRENSELINHGRESSGCSLFIQAVQCD